MFKPCYQLGSLRPSARPSAWFLAVPIGLLAASPANAVSFRFDFGRNVSDEFQFAAQAAADSWSSVLKDETVVDLRIEYTDLSSVGGSVLGGVQPGKVKVKYEDYVNALFRDAISTNDFKGLDSLQLSAKGREAIQDFQAGDLDAGKSDLDSKRFSFLMDGQFSKRGWEQGGSQPDFIDNNDNDNNKSVLLTRAQAKALKLTESKERGLDAIIKLNSAVEWDFNQKDGIEGDRYDLTSVLQHEIGHALGIVSGVDALDFLAASSEPVDIEKNKFSYLTPMDFYRYSNESAEQGVADLSFGGEKYFSLDGGQSAVTDEYGRTAYFSTGSQSSGGDGYQGSHWKETDGTPLGVMNPSLQKGKTNQISQLDLTLLDVIGWDLESNNVQRAAAIGLDWNKMQAELAAERQTVVNNVIAQSNGTIPDLESTIGDAATEIDLKFNQKVQDKFDELEKKLLGKDGQKKWQKEQDKFYQEVLKASEERNKSLRKLPEEIEKIDKEVRKWLDEDEDKLAKELREASAPEVNRFFTLVKALSPAEQAVLEPRLAAAVGQFADEPNKIVKELLKSSGPANPIGWGYFPRWWFYFQEDGDQDLENYNDDLDDALEEYNDDLEDASDDTQLAYLMAALESEDNRSEENAPLTILPSTSINTATMQPLSAATLKLTRFENSDNAPKSVPEPTSVLALFGIAVLGIGIKRGKA
ncbi:MAG: NF038122 family metalloprotease [Cyanobacteria bacterium J06648_10]